MKYKGIELKDSESELRVDVEIIRERRPNDDEGKLFKYIDEIGESVLEVFADYPEKITIETLWSDLLSVRCEAITFDMNGVILLMDIYRIILMLVPSDLKIRVCVHVDGEACFTATDGTAYNEDVVTLDEFLDNIEYEDDELWRKKEAT